MLHLNRNGIHASSAKRNIVNVALFRIEICKWSWLLTVIIKQPLLNECLIEVSVKVINALESLLFVSLNKL